MLNSTLVTMTCASERAILIERTNISTKTDYLSINTNQNCQLQGVQKVFWNGPGQVLGNLNNNFTINWTDPKLDLNYELASCWI